MTWEDAAGAKKKRTQTERREMFPQDRSAQTPLVRDDQIVWEPVGQSQAAADATS